MRCEDGCDYAEYGDLLKCAKCGRVKAIREDGKWLRLY